MSKCPKCLTELGYREQKHSFVYETSSRSPDDSIATTMKASSPRMEPFRSKGFLNKDYDMGRVYIDLPIIEAKKLINALIKV